MEKPFEEPSVELEQPEDPPENGTVQVLTGIREKLGDGSSKNPLGHPDGFPGAFKLEGKGSRTLNLDKADHLSVKNRFELSVDP